ncbi:hypothetical protein AV530_000534 [Patagioenas fasciata monilis]|uniref:Uncharacterized protein n=1 Tax=Patagioenas fasciata monilis TaxID=372326 RepID=A0A1V4IG03_PATFA|nr:hypothetical protein AV530_000534 [Patagioenas fasciata monilis]
MRNKLGGTGLVCRVVVLSKYAVDSPWEDTRSLGASSLQVLAKNNISSRSGVKKVSYKIKNASSRDKQGGEEHDDAGGRREETQKERTSWQRGERQRCLRMETQEVKLIMEKKRLCFKT